MKYFLRQLQASAPFTNVPLVYQAEMTQLSKLAKEVGLPLYLHSRDTMGDFCRVMASVGRGQTRLHIANEHMILTCEFIDAHAGMGGIVHSFDGSAEEAAELIELGFYIGVNGCSLRTDQNIEVIKTIPLDRIVAETDAPW
jgi:TatD DNase family protein